MAQQRTPRHGHRAATAAWLGDALGAALVAGGLALGVGVVSGEMAWPLWAALILFLFLAIGGFWLAQRRDQE